MREPRLPPRPAAYDVLLRLFPSSFRVEYGPEMRADFAARRQQTEGSLAILLLWLDTVIDAVKSFA